MDAFGREQPSAGAPAPEPANATSNENAAACITQAAAFLSTIINGLRERNGSMPASNH
jgi:hypothetical protein